MSSDHRPRRPAIATLILGLSLTLLAAACAPSPESAAEATAILPVRATLPAPLVEQIGGPTPEPSTESAAVSSTDLPVTATETAVEPTATATLAPTSTPEPTATPTPVGPQDINGIPLSAIAPMDEATAENVREIYAIGQARGRDAGTLSKLGDSTILNPHFMGPFDEGEFNLGEWIHLGPTIERYAGSFERHGVAARHGLHSWTVFDPLWADKDWCEPNETLLDCEFRLNNPSVLFIRLGSNDAGAPSGFRYNVAEVIKTTIEAGIIPILGTKADRFEGDNTNNELIRELAAEFNVPLWDFDLVADTLPGRGLDTDNVHLIIDELPHDYTQAEAFQRGHAMQDLTALVVLDQVRQAVVGE